MMQNISIMHVDISQNVFEVLREDLMPIYIKKKIDDCFL